MKPLPILLIACILFGCESKQPVTSRSISIKIENSSGNQISVKQDGDTIVIDTIPFWKKVDSLRFHHALSISYGDRFSDDSVFFDDKDTIAQKASGIKVTPKTIKHD